MEDEREQSVLHPLFPLDTKLLLAGIYFLRHPAFSASRTDVYIKNPMYQPSFAGRMHAGLVVVSALYS